MLRQLILSRKIAELTQQRTALEDVRDGLAERRAAMSKRESEITQAINEVTEETSAEDKAAVEAEADKWAEDDAALTNEENDNEQKRSEIQKQIDDLNAELEKLNQRAAAPVIVPETIRKDAKPMIRKFFNLSSEQRDALFAREDMKSFIGTVRAAYTEKRAITNAGLLIPDVLLPILRQVAEETSKLMKYVTVRNVPGTSRQNIMGDIPEAVWTEQCAKLNELSLTFYNRELDGYKVGGFIAVCNAILEDADDVTLATEVLTAIGKAIGLAIDKAIVFGTDVKMPMGIFTRLAQTAAPEDYPATYRPWVDLHTKNIKTIASSKTGIDVFKEIVKAAGVTRNKYASGARFWAMNETTWSTLLVEAMSINAAGAIVSGQGMTMPIVGGDIVLVDFMPDNMIVGGYGASYLLVERAGTQLATSEHYRFVEDQTVFRGTARYDGEPVIAESFVAIGLGAAPSAAGISFAADTANAANAANA